MKRWEYINLWLTQDAVHDHRLLMSYGEAGWELITIITQGVSLVAYFKREKDLRPAHVGRT